MSKEKNQPQEEELLKNEETVQEAVENAETTQEEVPAQELTVEEQLANMLAEAQQMVNEERDKYLRLATTASAPSRKRLNSSRTAAKRP